MAEFTVKPQAQPPADYTGSSRGINASPNTAIGTLFEGLGASLEGGIVEADRQVKEGIREDIFDQVDSIQAEFGVDSATDIEGDATSAVQITPAGVTNAMRHLNGLQASYERGNLRESHYWARMNSMVRQLRGKYPGYRAEIDSMVSSVVGTRPANALRSELFQEWQANATDADDTHEYWVKAAGNGPGLPPDFFAREQEGNPYTTNEIMNWVSEHNKHQWQTQAKITALNLEQENGTLSATKATQVFRTEATSTVNRIINDTTSTMGQQFRALMARSTSAGAAGQGDTRMSAQEQEGLRANFRELRTNLTLQLDSLYSNPDTPFAQYVTEADKQAAIDSAMAPIAILEESLMNEEYGTLSATTNMLAAMKEDQELFIFDKVPATQFISGLKAAIGETPTNLFLSMNPQLRDQVTQAFSDVNLTRGILQQNYTMGEFIDDGEEAGMPSEYFDSAVTQWQRFAKELSSGQFPEDAVQAKVNFMFGEGALGVLDRIDPNEQVEYFKRVASGQVTKQMLALKESGDTESWNTYTRWVTQSFFNLFSKNIQSLPGTGTDRRGVSVSWDPSTTGFKVSGSAAGALAVPMLGGVVPNLADASVRASQTINQQAIGDLNTAIRVIAPIIQAEGGDVNEELFDLLLRMGYNPDKPEEQDLIQMLGGAVSSWLGGTPSDPAQERADGNN